jgi:hypothetical protein
MKYIPDLQKNIPHVDNTIYFSSLKIGDVFTLYNGETFSEIYFKISDKQVTIIYSRGGSQGMSIFHGDEVVYNVNAFAIDRLPQNIKG